MLIPTVANWQKGDDVIVHPSVQGEKVKELFGDNVKTVYVRIFNLHMIELRLTVIALPPIHP